MGKTEDFKRDKWEALHSQSRFLPRYPQDDVVRWILGSFTRAERLEKRILDLGCGGGRHAILMAQEGFITQATDRSPAGVVETQKRAKEAGLNIKCIESQITKLPYEDRFFDALLCYGVLCYLERRQLEITINEIHRILKPGGEAFIMTRSDRDFRINSSCHLENTTYRIEGDSSEDYPAKDEIGMVHSFLSREDVEALFSSFSELKLDRNTLSFRQGRYVNDDWLILAVR